MVLQRTELHKQLQVLKTYPDLSSEKEHDLFPAWVLFVLATGDFRTIAESITGGPNDGCVDALYTDRRHKKIWIVQGKYRDGTNKYEGIDEIRRFAGVAESLSRGPSSDPEGFFAHVDKSARGAGPKLREASDLVRHHGYQANLVFASLGRFREEQRKEATRTVKRALGNLGTIDLQGAPEVDRLLDYYIHDIAPAIPELRLPIEAGELREDSMGSPDMVAWTITAGGDSVAKLYDTAGPPLFARNVRAYLGDKTRVNKAIHETIKNDAEHFWFLNNGITIICDSAGLDGQSLLMTGAQIINGQQTTRSLHAAWLDSRLKSKVRRARVAVRVIRFDGQESGTKDRIVSDIVEATNHQNSVSQADLRSNDNLQIDLGRELAVRGYRYIRKKSSPAERATQHLSFLKRRISKEEIAQAVGGALHESIALREGQTPLFDRNRYYDEIFGQNVDLMLMYHWLWKATKQEARGSTGRQAAKFLIHYEFCRDNRAELSPRRRRFTSAMESNEEAVVTPLARALSALFDVALASFRANRNVEGKKYEIKPYFQSRDVDAYQRFLEYWNGSASAAVTRYESARSRLSEVLADG